MPGDVAVTGFDDIVPALPGGMGLTTVAQPYAEIGRRMVEVLRRRLKSPCAPTVVISLPALLMILENSEPGIRCKNSEDPETMCRKLACSHPSAPIARVPHTCKTPSDTKKLPHGTK